MLSFGEQVTELMERHEVPVTFSSKHDAQPAAELAKEFCERNGLIEPRDGWEKNLAHPKAGGTRDETD